MRRAPRPSLRWRIRGGAARPRGGRLLTLAAPLVLLLLPALRRSLLRRHERADPARTSARAPSTPSGWPRSRTSAPRTNSARSATSSPESFRRADDPRRAVADRLLRPPCLRAREPRRRQDDPLRALDLARRLPPCDLHQQLRRQPRGLQGRLHRQGGLRPERVLQQRRRATRGRGSCSSRGPGASRSSRTTCAATRSRPRSSTRRTTS